MNIFIKDYENIRIRDDKINKPLKDLLNKYKNKIDYIYINTRENDISDYILKNNFSNSFKVIYQKTNYPLLNSKREHDGITYVLEYNQ